MQDLPAPAETQPKRRQIRGKLAVALNLLAQGHPIPVAARRAGTTGETVRTALYKPHVIKYLKERRKALLNELCSANPKRLAEIRDAETGTAAVKAIALMEMLSEDAPDANVPASDRIIQQQTPGVVIQILTVGTSVGTDSPPNKQVMDNKHLSDELGG